MLYYRKAGWKIRARDQTAVDFAVDLLPAIPENFVFKRKNNRLIFRFNLNNKEFFAKLNIPQSFYHKVKSFLFHNSYFEFQSALLLEKSGFNVVNCAGWASKGCSDMLITENPGDKYIQASLFWKNILPSNHADRKAFLDSFALLLKHFLESQLYHRDFHFGNILAARSDDKIDFIFVDTLGIRKKRKTNIYNSGLLRMLGILKTLTNQERLSFLIKTGVIASASEYETEWRSILKALCLHNSRKWFGRRHKIIKGHSRYSESIYDENGNDFFVKPDYMEEVKLNLDLSNNFDVIYMDRKTAKKQWLYSCYLDSMGIDHRKIIAWKKNIKGKDTLFLERIEKFTIYSETQKIDEFKEICSAPGIILNNLSKDIILRDGNPCLIYPDPKIFNSNRFFF